MTPRTILLVDDEAVVRNVMTAVVVRNTYHVLEADSAAEALRVCASFDGIIDLLIADHNLKTMSARQVAERIQKSRPGLKILQISGYSLEVLRNEGGIIAGAEFLQKPFLPKTLLDKVSSILNTPSKTFTA
jgi:two-component system cell cycle sensor histidine kinase/response regulator CckA